MDNFWTSNISLSTLSILTILAGFVLLLWGILIHGLKAGPFVLPPIIRYQVRIFVLSLAVVFLALGSYGTWNSLFKPTPTLHVLTGLGEEELVVFNEIMTDFEKQYEVEVEVENLEWEVALDRLEQGGVDLVTFDINGRRELVFRRLIEELPEEQYKGLIPSAINPVLLKYLEMGGIRFFAPYRPNVQLVYLNKEKFAEIGMESPKTWNDVKECARIFHERDGEARVVIQATQDVISLTLLQIIRAADGNPYDLLNPRTKSALEFVRDLSTYVYPKCTRVNWNTACGFLLTDSVYLARNWAFTLDLIHEGGRVDDYEVYEGWSWSEESRPSNLLGGEFLALPRQSKNKELAVVLMRYLMSKEVQGKLATELCWPAMRLDALGEAEPWQVEYHKVINKALTYAEPAPEIWWPEMPDIYRRMFYEVISLDSEADIKLSLIKFQAEIDAILRD